MDEIDELEKVIREIIDGQCAKDGAKEIVAMLKSYKLLKEN